MALFSLFLSFRAKISIFICLFIVYAYLAFFKKISSLSNFCQKRKKIKTMEETQIYFWYDDTSFIFFMFTSLYINSRITSLKLIKQLNPKEFNYYCYLSNQTDLNGLDTNKNNSKFTANVSTRVILSGCYYVNKDTGIYSSYGMEILEESNTSFIKCISNHLTEFASGWITVPNSIDFDFVWVNASFDKNVTVYSLVIGICLAYLMLLLLTINLDRMDEYESVIRSLPSNKQDDTYFFHLVFKAPIGSINLKVIFFYKKI